LILRRISGGPEEDQEKVLSGVFAFATLTKCHKALHNFPAPRQVCYLKHLNFISVASIFSFAPPLRRAQELRPEKNGFTLGLYLCQQGRRGGLSDRTLTEKVEFDQAGRGIGNKDDAVETP